MWVQSARTSNGAAKQRISAPCFDNLANGSCLELLPVAAWFCDKEGKVRQANRRAIRLWGRTPKDDISSERFCGSHKLLYADDTPMARENSPMAEVLLTGNEVKDRIIGIERPDGARIAVLVNIAPVFDEDGNLLGAINTLQDITEFRSALETAELNEQKLHMVLDALPGAIYTTDASGRVTFYNKAAAAMVGREPQVGSDRWCVAWRLLDQDGQPLPHEEGPMAIALKEKRALAEVEAIVERPDGRQVPFLAYPTPLFDASGELTGGINMLVDISERKRATEAQNSLIDELNHRVKNTLATVQSIAWQSAKSARSQSDFVEKFSSRLQSLAHAHTILTETTWCGADLRELVRGQVLLSEIDGERVAISGPNLTLAAQPALHLALMLHELAMNARRYGALSVPEGRLAVTWRVEGQEKPEFVLSWQERSGPPVIETASRGFGLKLIERSLSAYGGHATVSFGVEGVSCNIRLPISDRGKSGLRDDREEHARSPTEEDGDRSGSGDRPVRRVLVVEDEPLVAMDIEACLTQAGFQVVGPVGSIESAMVLIEDGDFDIALMDANLAGQRVDALAEALEARGVPFAFVSGYGRDGLPEGFKERLLVSKPFNDRQLVGAVSQLSASEANQGSGKTPG